MKRLLLLFVLFISINSIGQQKIYGQLIPEVNKYVVIFLIYSEDDALLNGMLWKAAEDYNKYVTKHANKIFNGEKVFLTQEEIDNLDFSKGNYRLIFRPVFLVGSEGRRYPYVFGTYDKVTRIFYIANKFYKNNHNSECKSEIKFLEKSRLNAMNK